MLVAPLCGLGLVYLSLCYLGTLLMRLVLVQVVEVPVARYAFASTFATAVSLFLVVFLDAAAAAGASGRHLLLALPKMLFDALFVREDGGLGGETPVVLVFRALLGLLLCQILLVGPLLLLYLVMAKRAAVRRRRKEQAERGRAAARQLEAMDGDPYGRGKRMSKSLVARCCPGSWGTRIVCLMLCLVLAGFMLLFALRMGKTALSFLPLLQSLLHAAVALLSRVAAMVLQWATVPPEVQAPSTGSKASGNGGGEGDVDGSARGGQDPAAAAARIAAAALARVASPTLRLLYHVSEVLIANVGTAGVAMVGLLGGYAAVTTPYNYLVSYFYYRNREEVLVQAQQQLSKKQRYALSLCGGKMRRLAQESHNSRTRLAPGQEEYLYDKVNVQNERSNRSTGKGGGGWLGGLLSKTKAVVTSAASSTRARLGGGGTRTSAKDRQQLRMEADHAKGLSLFLYLKMDEVGYMLKEARRGNTWVGKLFALFGLLLGLYSLLKFALTAASLYLFRVSTQDPVTRAVSLLESYWVLPPQFQQQQRVSYASGGVGGGFSLTAIQVSAQFVVTLALVVNAWMIASSIRGLLLTIFQLTLSFTTVVTADTTAVMFAMLMAVYFAGQLILLRQSLPSPVFSPSLATAAPTLPSLQPPLPDAAAAAAEAFASTAAARLASAMGGGGEGEPSLLRTALAAAVDGIGGGESGGGGGQHVLPLPLPHANVLFIVLGSLPIYFYQRLNDWCFIVGCLLTLIARRWVLGDPTKATVSVANG